MSRARTTERARSNAVARSMPARWSATPSVTGPTNCHLTRRRRGAPFGDVEERPEPGERTVVEVGRDRVRRSTDCGVDDELPSAPRLTPGTPTSAWPSIVSARDRSGSVGIVAMSNSPIANAAAAPGRGAAGFRPRGGAVGEGRAAWRVHDVDLGFAHDTPPIGDSPQLCQLRTPNRDLHRSTPRVTDRIHLDHPVAADATRRPLDRVRGAESVTMPPATCGDVDRSRRPDRSVRRCDAVGRTTRMDPRRRHRGQRRGIRRRRSQQCRGMDGGDRRLDALGRRCARAGDRLGQVADDRPTRGAAARWSPRSLPVSVVPRRSTSHCWVVRRSSRRRQ